MSEWETCKIDQIKASSKSAISIGPFGSRMKSDCYVSKGIPVIRGNNISDTPKFIDDFVFISEEKAEELRSSKVYKDDIVFPHRGNIGEAGIIIESQYEKYIISSSLMKLSCDTKLVYPKFIYYFFKSNQGRRKLLENSSQVGTPGIATPLTSLKNIEIRLPLLQEQKAIADVLSCLDAKIENLRSQNQTLEKIAQTLFNHWFIDFEFPNDSGEPYKSSGGVMVASELGDIPVGWRVGKIGDEFEIIMGQSPAGSSFSEDEQGMIFFQGRTDFGFRFPKTRMYTTEPKRIAEESDVLVSVRAPVGDVNIAHKRCCIGRGLAAVKSKRKSYCLYKLKSFQKFFDVFESEGTVFGSINKQGFNDLSSCIPLNNNLDDFDNIVKVIDEKILTNSNQIQTLTKTRDTLLPKLMSGQIRVAE